MSTNGRQHENDPKVETPEIRPQQINYGGCSTDQMIDNFMRATMFMAGMHRCQVPKDWKMRHEPQRTVSTITIGPKIVSTITINYAHERRRPRKGRHKAEHRLNRKHGIKLVSPLLWLRVETLTNYRYALLDTGASINIISPTTLQSFEHTRLCTQKVRVKGVVGSGDWSDWYLVRISFQNGQAIQVPCLKGASDAVGLLLGMPFVKQVNAIINARSKIIYTDVGDFAWGDRDHNQNVTPTFMAISDLTPEQEEELNKAFEGSILSQEAQAKLKKAFIEYKEVWTRSGYGHGQGVEHTFKLTSDRPIILPPRHIPQKWQQVLDEEMDKMIRDGVVEHSVSPYCTYPVLVAKKDGSVRFAVDYRRLNAVTIPDKTPIPRIEDLIASLEGSKYFALLDLRGDSGIFQSLFINDTSPPSVPTVASINFVSCRLA